MTLFEKGQQLKSQSIHMPLKTLTGLRESTLGLDFVDHHGIQFICSKNWNAHSIVFNGQVRGLSDHRYPKKSWKLRVYIVAHKVYPAFGLAHRFTVDEWLTHLAVMLEVMGSRPSFSEISEIHFLESM